MVHSLLEFSRSRLVHKTTEMYLQQQTLRIVPLAYIEINFEKPVNSAFATLICSKTYDFYFNVLVVVYKLNVYERWLTIFLKNYNFSSSHEKQNG